ncbi:MAG: hypothetical protein ABI859_18460 [Pseudomonadota bacterium]
MKFALACALLATGACFAASPAGTATTPLEWIVRRRLAELSF